jgi:hypothetical protein
MSSEFATNAETGVAAISDRQITAIIKIRRGADVIVILIPSPF